MARRAAQALAVVALVLVVALVAILHGRGATPEAADAGEVLDAGPQELLVVVNKVEGEVEVQRGKDGPWAPVGPGAKLRQDDAIRTGAGGAVELETAGHVVRLTQNTDVRVAELTAGLTHYFLGSGLISAAASAGGKVDKKLQVDVAGTDVAVRAGDARFQMTSNGEGTVAVAAQEGDVQVGAAGKEVVLHPGQRTLVLPQKPPADPEPLATSLLLKVAWPTEKETNKRIVTLSGRTDAGALVYAMGRPVHVGADGTFKAKVTLAEGQNSLDAVALDASGNRLQQAGPRIVVDTKGAASKFKTDDLWKQKDPKRPR